MGPLLEREKKFQNSENYKINLVFKFSDYLNNTNILSIVLTGFCLRAHLMGRLKLVA